MDWFERAVRDIDAPAEGAGASVDAHTGHPAGHPACHPTGHPTGQEADMAAAPPDEVVSWGLDALDVQLGELGAVVEHVEHVEPVERVERVSGRADADDRALWGDGLDTLDTFDLDTFDLDTLASVGITLGAAGFSVGEAAPLGDGADAADADLDAETSGPLGIRGSADTDAPSTDAPTATDADGADSPFVDLVGLVEPVEPVDGSRLAPEAVTSSAIASDDTGPDAAQLDGSRPGPPATATSDDALTGLVGDLGGGIIPRHVVGVEHDLAMGAMGAMGPVGAMGAVGPGDAGEAEDAAAAGDDVWDDLGP